MPACAIHRLWFVNIAISLLAIFTAAASGFTRQKPMFVGGATGIVLLVASRELEFFAVRPVPLAIGLLIQAAGAVLCLRSLSK